MDLGEDLDEWEPGPGTPPSPSNWSAESTVGYGQPPVLPVDSGDEKEFVEEVPFELRIAEL